MRQFFKFVFASCLGAVLAGVVVIGILSIVIGGIASTASAGKTANLEPNSVLVLKLDQIVPERTNNLPMNPFAFEQTNVLGLHDIINHLEYAKTDKNIKALYIDVSMVLMGQSTSRKIREAIIDFKESEKPVFAYAHSYTQGAYYLASAADSIYVNPIGTVDFRGFGATLAFFKEMLDKIGVEMQIFYAGQFKSATEPLRLNQMSDQNRLQIREYIDGMYKIFQEDIAESRGLTVEQLDAIADEMKVRNAEDAVTHGLVDKVAYQDEVTVVVKDLLGMDKEDKLKTITLDKYATAVSLPKNLGEKDKIAVLYAEGTINDGPTNPGEINGDNYVSMLQKIRKDKSVKALVLRVNSGGGSVLASDRILREIRLIQENGIPVVTTMGDVAASGGYYIACFSDSILAEPNTLTGSIGVFGILPNMQELFNDKLGIYFDSVKTNTYATSFDPAFKLNSDEFNILQQGVEQTYDRFLSLVAEGRGMSKEQVHEVAQGRVWTGQKAQELGLVDKMGGLDEAIDIAASLADIETYRLLEYPKVKDPFEQLINQLMGKDDDVIRSAFLKKEFGEHYGLYQYMKNMRELKGPQARLPFYLEIN